MPQEEVNRLICLLSATTQTNLASTVSQQNHELNKCFLLEASKVLDIIFVANNCVYD